MNYCTGYPERDGKIDICPQIQDGNLVTVTIVGDPDGLRYLAKLLDYLANYDLKKSQAPSGAREHIHLHRNEQLGDHSCEVSLCRADAVGTGELPEFMQ